MSYHTVTVVDKHKGDVHIGTGPRLDTKLLATEVFTDNLGNAERYYFNGPKPTQAMYDALCATYPTLDLLWYYGDLENAEIEIAFKP